MLKKLKEKLYNNHINKELKKIKEFNDILYAENTLLFVEYAKDGIHSFFTPKSIYAIKQVIKKLNFGFILNMTLENMEKIIKKIILDENLDMNKIDECLNLFNKRKQLYEDSLSGRVVKDIK